MPLSLSILYQPLQDLHAHSQVLILLAKEIYESLDEIKIDTNVLTLLIDSC